MGLQNFIMGHRRIYILKNIVVINVTKTLQLVDFKSIHRKSQQVKYFE